MVRYIFLRLALAIPTLLGVMTVVFFSLRLLSGDVARRIAGDAASAEHIAAIRRQLGLDQPLLKQYADFILNSLQGDFGTSFIYRTPVVDELWDTLPYTLVLAAAAVTIAMVIGVLLGVAAAARAGSWLDTAVSAFAVAGLSIPLFWAGLLLMILFSLTLRWLPTSGVGTAAHFIMPSIVLALGPTGVVARITRAAMLDVMSQEFIRAAAAKGASPARLLFRHALRHALTGVVTIVGLQFGVLLGGAVVTESVFSIPGMGMLMAESVGHRDYPLVQGALVLFAGLYILVNLVTDVIYKIINPRVSYD